MARVLLVLIAVFGVTAVSPVTAAGFKVIANSSVKASDISIDDLNAVYLATRTSLPDGSHVEPVLARTGSAHDAFVAALGKTSAGLLTYYRTLVFTGKAAMPKLCGSDAEVIAYVAKTKGAIGYVSAEARAPGTKILGLK